MQGSDKIRLKERLLNNCEINSQTGCWEWKLALSTWGYGQLKLNGKSRVAHRLSYESFVGNIPEGMVVMHSCDNRKCINPEHMSLGSQAENIKDKVRKNRQAKGERIACAKLTIRDVHCIRVDTRSQRKIAADYGVSRIAIRQIKRGNTWRHVA